MNRPLAQGFLDAAGSYLNAEAVGLEQRGDPEAIHIALCYFLVKKLRGYADRLGLSRGQAWMVLDAKYTVLAERAKLSDSALSGLASGEQRREERGVLRVHARGHSVVHEDRRP